MPFSIAGTLYFVAQRIRGGVSPAMIAHASSLMHGSCETLDAHVAERLKAVHGATAGRLWLRRQPPVDRSTLRQAMAQVRRAGTPRRVELRRTSGSSGTPFQFVKDVEMTAWMDAVMWAAYAWHGVRPGDRQARFWGMPRSPLQRVRRRLMDRVLGRRRLSAFDVAPADCARFHRSLQRCQPTHAYGYPTLIREFVERCTEAGLDGRVLGLRVVITTGELLSEDVRERLQRFFGCPVVNEYGCTESGLIALECERGTMHVLPVAVIAEILRGDGTPAGPGEMGEVVVTDLFGAVMPLVRYRLQDQVRIAPAASCACGRALPAIEMEVGRRGRFIETPDGRKVFSTILAYSVPAEVLRFRAHQSAPDRLDVLLVAGGGFDAVTTPRLFEERLRAELGEGMEVVMRVVSDIPYEPSGKLRYFVPLSEQEKSSEPAIAVKTG